MICMALIANLPTKSGQAAAVQAVRRRLAKAAVQMTAPNTNRQRLAAELLALAAALEELESKPARNRICAASDDR